MYRVGSILNQEMENIEFGIKEQKREQYCTGTPLTHSLLSDAKQTLEWPEGFLPTDTSAPKYEVSCWTQQKWLTLPLTHLHFCHLASCKEQRQKVKHSYITACKLTYLFNSIMSWAFWGLFILMSMCVCLYEFMHHVCAGTLKRPKEGIETPGTIDAGGCKLWYVNWEQNVGFLEKKVLLTPKTSLPTPKKF